MYRHREYRLTNAVNRVEEDIRTILARRQSSRYFEGIVLLYSLIENVLKWLVYLKIIWDRSDHVLPPREVDTLKQFCNQQDFHSALNLALAIGLIKHGLFSRIERVRRERNDVVHQCYLFTHRRNRRVLRAKLEKLVRVADALFEVFAGLIRETGADDSYEIFRIRRSRHMLV